MRRVLERNQYIFVVLAFVLIGCSSEDDFKPTFTVDLTEEWQTASPASVGLDESLIARGVNKAEDAARFGSLLIVKNGYLVIEHYFHGNNADSLNDVRSVTKSVVATLTGIAIEEGFIASIDETLGDYLHPHVYDLRPETQAISIRHLLEMTSGFLWNENSGSAYNYWITSGDHIGHVLERPLLTQPGVDFNYNSGAVHLLGVLLQEATGQTLPDFADTYLFDRIGITSSRWEPSQAPYVNGGSGIDLRPRDLARLGQLYLQNGISGDEQVVPESWIEAVSTPKFTWRASTLGLPSYSYGYLWWTEDFPMYFAWGYGGQFIFVVPDLDMVVVTTTNWGFLSQEGGPASITATALDVVLNDVIPSAGE